MGKTPKIEVVVGAIVMEGWGKLLLVVDELCVVGAETGAD